MSVYLDYNASTPIDDRVLDVMIDVYKNHYGNADSRTHSYGDGAKSIVENARAQVASLLDVSQSEVFFTSGSTESTNIAIQGLEHYAVETGKNHFITSSIEHKAVLETIRAQERKGCFADYINPESSGLVLSENVLAKVTPRTVLVSIMHVNNETGIIQPVDQIGNELSERGVLFHVDATQSCGKLVEELKHLKYDMLSFSAHKMSGPQGVGVLVLKKKHYKLPPIQGIMFGGQQEKGIRPGTIPVALVAGCGKACELAAKEYKQRNEKTKTIKQVLLTTLAQSGVEYYFNGCQEYCISNTINLCLPGISSEALMLATKQYCSISNGSACTSRSYSPSYVLSAMGVPYNQIENSIRISWGPDTNEDLLRIEFMNLLATAKSMVH